MKERNVDFFYEGEIVPETVKKSIYKMEDSSSSISDKSVFENIMTALISEFVYKKNISLISVQKFVNEKVKNLKTYVLHFEDDKGNSFNCSYIGEHDALKYGTTHILASSIIFAFAQYGCKLCNFKDQDCEFCDRTKIDKIFPPELKLTIKHNMKEFTKVFGKNSVKSIKDFCEGYYSHMRNQNVKEIEDIKDNNNSLPPEIKEIVNIDLGIISYVVKMTTTILGEYANNNKDVRNIMKDYTNVEKSFLSVIQQLQKYYHFIKLIKDSPNNVTEEFVENIKQVNEEDYDIDIDDDDDEDDDEGESWKKDFDEA
jgi:hypothetical protein